MSLQQLFFFSISAEPELQIFGCCYKNSSTFYHLFKLILLSHKWHQIVLIISPLFHGTVLLTQTIAWNGRVRKAAADTGIDSSVLMLCFAVPRRIAHWLSVQIIMYSNR